MLLIICFHHFPSSCVYVRIYVIGYIDVPLSKHNTTDYQNVVALQITFHLRIEKLFLDKSGELQMRFA